MKNYVIKSITKIEEEKALVRYTLNGSKVRVTRRAIQLQEGIESILFRGIKCEVEFEDQDSANASSIVPVEIYDERVKRDDPDRLSNLKIANENFDYSKVNIEKLKRTIPKPIAPVSETNEQGEENIKHIKYNEIKICVESGIPVYLYGPAGSGKNHVLQQVAEDLNLEFYFTNSVQQEYKLTGFIDAGGKYHETEFYRAFKNGGLFFLDEIDASIPEVLVLLNAAIANGYFEFPNGKIYAHDNFKVVSAGNTVGTGADEQYSGRLQLDQATLDRFAMIEFDYDKRIELAIAKGNIELVNFIRGLRKDAYEKGISATFSYRSITMVTQLEGKLDLKRVIEIAVVKGMDKDTINTLTTTPNNRYSKALWTLKLAS